MYELRILSGLHRGATLPLGDESHLVGASEDADVVLVDDSIKTRHAMLSRTDAGWVLSAEEGSLFGADSNLRQTLIDVMPGDFVRLGDIWITIVRQDASWEAPPPVPVDVVFDAASEDDDPSEAASPTSNMPPLATDQESGAGRRLGRRMLAIPVMAMVVLSAAAAYALAPESLQEENLSKQAFDPMNGQMTPEKWSGKQADPAVGAGRTLTATELSAAFRKRLADAELLQYFDMTLNDKSWTMQANLNSERTARFERILQGFLREHQITFPVNAKLVSVEAMLPFKIHQVVTGANASVVTREGQRLYVGEEYRGVRVVAIQDNHLTFAGKRKIEMDW